jgi:hypothetical protein
MLMTLEFSDLLSEKKKKMESFLDMIYARPQIYDFRLNNFPIVPINIDKDS